MVAFAAHCNLQQSNWKVVQLYYLHSHLIPSADQAALQHKCAVFSHSYCWLNSKLLTCQCICVSCRLMAVHETTTWECDRTDIPNIYKISSNFKSFVPLKNETYLFYLPRSNHSPPRLYKTILLMLFRVKLAVCCEIHTKHINAMWTQSRNF